jgi:hypothetical protein
MLSVKTAIDTSESLGCCDDRENRRCPIWDTPGVSGILIGYARVSTDAQDLTAQRDGLTALGVTPARIYVDHGLTGRRRDRPGFAGGDGGVSRRRHVGGD